MLSLGAIAKRQFRVVICDSGGSACEEYTNRNFQAYIDEHKMIDGPIAARLSLLGRLDEMAQDKAWHLPRIDRKFITTTFRYLLARANGVFSAIESQLLQALAIDLLIEDCGAELQAYEEFCSLRAGTAGELPFEIQTRQDWLRYKREMLQKEGKRRFLGMRRSSPRRKAGLI